MENEDQYFYIKYTPPFNSRRELAYLMKWNTMYYLDVYENVDYSQVIHFSIYKLCEKDTKPTGDKYTKVKPVIKEIFLDHYKLAIKYIHETTLDDGEFYIRRYSKDWTEYQYFSGNEKEKQNIKISFSDKIDEFTLKIECEPGHKYRPRFRREGTAIPAEIFKQLLKLSVQFFYDPDGMPILLGEYITKFNLIVGGDTKVEGLVISAAKSFEEIFKQLQLRTDYLEKRLIENDEDTSLDRAKLRGELEGIGYATKVINMNK